VITRIEMEYIGVSKKMDRYKILKNGIVTSKSLISQEIIDKYS